MTDQGDYYMNKLPVPDMGKSTLFPTFNVNVPMPSGTAAPAAPTAQSAGDTAAAAAAPIIPPAS